MNKIFRSREALILRTFVGLFVFTADALPAADDIRQKVKASTDSPEADSVIDPHGVVFGLPFGVSEDDVVRKFGKPAGFIRLDAKRSAMLYGPSFLLLFYQGKFDAVRVGQSMIDWNVSRWLESTPPFSDQGWKMSNGLREDMSLKEVIGIIKISPPEGSKYRCMWSTDTTNLELNFSHYTDRGETDEAYTLHGFLLARKHDGKDFWSEPPMPGMGSNPLKDKKVIGISVKATKSGIRPLYVFKNGPADKAGIKAGDLLEKIDGKSTVGMSAAEFVRLIDEGDSHELLVVPREGKPSVVTLAKVDGSTIDGTLSGSPADLLEVSVGEEAPDFEVTAQDGKTLKLSDLKGKPVIINFTATWCQPCRMEAPKLVAAYAKFQDRGLEIVSVYLDAKDKDVLAYAKELGATWPIRNDGKAWEGDTAMTYGVSGVPTNILVGKDGKILQTALRGPDWEAALEKAL